VGKRHVVGLTRIVIAEEGNSVGFFFSWSLLGEVCAGVRREEDMVGRW
jgi:hypothetical protein